MSRSIPRHFLTLAAALSFAAAAPVFAQQAAPATPAAPPAAAATPSPEPTEVLEELDEVVVRGERLADAIRKAEDQFYDLFNQLNKDDRYDMGCPYLNLDPDNPGSRLRTRVCLPGFVATAMADWAKYKFECEPQFSHFDANKDGRITKMEAVASSDLSFQFDDLDQDDDSQLSEFGEFENFERWAQMNMNCLIPPPPDLVLMEGTDDWYKHMMKVTNSDPRLREMAGKLDGLFHELADVQSRYRTLEDAVAIKGRIAPSTAGPRPR